MSGCQHAAGKCGGHAKATSQASAVSPWMAGVFMLVRAGACSHDTAPKRLGLLRGPSGEFTGQPAPTPDLRTGRFHLGLTQLVRCFRDRRQLMPTKAPMTKKKQCRCKSGETEVRRVSTRTVQESAKAPVGRTRARATQGSQNSAPAAVRLPCRSLADGRSKPEGGWLEFQWASPTWQAAHGPQTNCNVGKSSLKSRRQLPSNNKTC